MAGKTLFSDQQVREIKANLVLGVPCSALARRWGCGEETIGRIKRGLTYRHVKVLGEEALRPEVAIVGMTGPALMVMSGVSDEDIEAQGRALFEAQEAMRLQRATVEIVEEVSEMSELEKIAKNFLGNTPLVRKV